MPSISQYLKEGYSEPKYSDQFNNKIQERVSQLNVAQLQGMYSVLEEAKNGAQSALWRRANAQVMSEIKTPLDSRKAVETLVVSKQEEAQLRITGHEEKKKAIRREALRVQKMIMANARKKAVQDVKSEEEQRRAVEKVDIMTRIYEGEARQQKWWFRIAICYTILLVIICVVLKDVLYILAGIGFITIVCGFLIYKAYLFTKIVPVEPSEADIEALVVKRSDELISEARTAIMEKERKFQEAQRKEKAEYKIYKAEKKEKVCAFTSTSSVSFFCLLLPVRFFLSALSFRFAFSYFCLAFCLLSDLFSVCFT